MGPREVSDFGAKLRPITHQQLVENYHMFPHAAPHTQSVEMMKLGQIYYDCYS